MAPKDDNGIKTSSSFEAKFNLSLNNMSKKIKTNIAFLQGFLKTAKPEVKNKITNVIDLYSSRKITNFTTAENMIIKLNSRPKGEGCESKQHQKGLSKI